MLRANAHTQGMAIYPYARNNTICAHGTYNSFTWNQPKLVSNLNNQPFIRASVHRTPGQGLVTHITTITALKH